MARQRDRRAAALKRQAKALKGLIEKTKNTQNLPGLAEFHEAIFEAKGGFQEVARIWWEVFENATPAMRVRLMTEITGSVKDLYDRNLTRSAEDDDPTLWTDDELIGYLQEAAGDDGEEASDSDEQPEPGGDVHVV